ncbi:hypothetical protein [Haloferula sp. A504]|uniref:hypothetical protein n=1 Tax=Haloferula sp. A504 TaxID=3373601 RepID=UPI0031C14275|nr:hypothetical protein [Verrucomicrobiaceae bacterium E54]
MDTNATTTKRRRPARKAEDFHSAWKELAPDAAFGGLTLAELETAMGPLEAALDELRTLTVSRSAALKVRNQEEKALNALLIRVAHGVRSHPDHGEDSPLYRAMGFVPKSERATGLTRRSDEENEEAAA